MRFTRFHTLLLASALTVLVTLVGCGGKKPVTVQGKVVFPNTVKLVETDSVEIRFAPSDGKGRGAASNLSVKDSTFAAKDVLPGKYKVTLKITPYPGMPDSEKRARAYENFNRSLEESQSKLSVDIGAEPQQSVTVDLVKNAVSKP